MTGEGGDLGLPCIGDVDDDWQVHWAPMPVKPVVSVAGVDAVWVSCGDHDGWEGGEECAGGCLVVWVDVVWAVGDHDVRSLSGEQVGKVVLGEVVEQEQRGSEHGGAGGGLGVALL